MGTTPLRVLIVEDSPEDALLVLAALENGGFAVTSRRVCTADAFNQALDEQSWEIILCDHAMPQFSGTGALRIVNERDLDVPFIYVSGTIGEEAAVEAMKTGASDYVMKDRLARLVPAVRRELRESAERRRAEAELRRQTRMNVALFCQSITCVALIDPEYRFIKVNDAFAAAFGGTADAYAGRDVAEVRSADERPEDVHARLEEVARGKTAHHRTAVAHMFPDRHITYWDSMLQPILDERGEVEFLFWLLLDVTDRRRAEETLVASEQRFRQVTENIDEVFWLTDADAASVIYVSPAYARVWGRSCESLRDGPWSWLDAVHPDDQARVRAAMQRMERGAFQEEYRIIRPDGEVRWVHDRAFPIVDREGRVYRLAGVAEDITHRRILEDQLRQSQKMEAVGRLAGGVAHDFNNLLTAIAMQASLLVSEPATHGEVQDGLQQILAACERAANLTRQLLTFSRRSQQQPREIDLADITDGMSRLLRRVLGEDVGLETSLAPSLPLVNADPSMMEQVLMNLAVNARDAMPGGGQLSLTVDAVDLAPSDAAVRPGARAGQFVRLRMADTGCGIPPEALPRIFEPFFTTKEQGKGTGLGLATVFGIVEQHKGWIDVASEPGRGTTFEIYLPALSAPRGDRPKAEPAAELPRGKATILVVEDDPAVRTLARMSLEHSGHTVLAASSAAEALALTSRLDPRLDLLVTDLVMPGAMSGRALAERLVARQPDLKVIFSSGYGSERVGLDPNLPANCLFLQKPYTVTELAGTVHRCLEAR